MRKPSIFCGIAVSLLRPVIGSNVEIDVVALNWVADVRKQIAKFAKQITNSTLSSFDSVFSNLLRDSAQYGIYFLPTSRQYNVVLPSQNRN